MDMNQEPEDQKGSDTIRKTLDALNTGAQIKAF